MKFLRLIFVFLCLALIILHPYTIYGKPGLLVAATLAGYGLFHGIKKRFAILFLLPALGLLLIGAIGVVSSLFNNIFQLNHLMSAISFNVLLLAAYGLWVYCERRNISRDEVLTAILFVVVFNSIVILLELQFESFRLLIESFLDPLRGGSINYAKGFRFRGVAGSGGAGLSLSIPVALTIALYLFERKILSLFLLIPIVAILLFSVLVIGRTGLILTLIPCALYLTQLLQPRRMAVTLALCVVVVAVSIALLQFATSYFSGTFGDGFVKYSFGFLLDGIEGIEKEGTVGVIAGFLTVLPLEFPQALVGYGFYGGSDFFPWTDSGYSRMFLSVGFVFGLMFYLIIFRTYFLGFKGNEFLIGTLILILAVAELKEPLLFSKIASRIFIITLVFCWFNRRPLYKFKRIRRGLLPDSNDGVQMGSSKL